MQATVHVYVRDNLRVSTRAYARLVADRQYKP